MPPSESSSMTASRPVQAGLAGRDAGRTVVTLRGEHDSSTVATLSETIARAIALDDADLVVDLSGVEFMSAATVGVILRAREFLGRFSRSLTLLSPSRSARHVINLFGLADLLDPSTVDGAPVAGAHGALGTWVAVPATGSSRPQVVGGRPPFGE